MSKLLLISLIYCISASFIQYNYAIELIPICKNDIFNYSDIEVNSVYKLNYDRQFQKVSSYTINPDVNFKDFFTNQEHTIKMNDYRRTYNDQFVKIFSDRFINNPTKFSEIHSINFDKTLENVNELKRFCKEELKFKFEFIVKWILDSGNCFSYTLKSLHSNQFDTCNKTIDEVKELFNSLEINHDQTFALAYESIDSIYENHQILSLDKFILHKYSKMFFDLRSSGELKMHIVLPFNDANYKENSSICLSADKLPKFYQKYLKKN